MEFMRKQLQRKRPLAARKECKIEGIKYKKHEYIDYKKHRYYFLNRAFIQKLIGHPKEGFSKPEGYGLNKSHDNNIEVVDKGRGWFDVEINGEAINDKSLRKPEADELAESYK